MKKDAHANGVMVDMETFLEAFFGRIVRGIASVANLESRYCTGHTPLMTSEEGHLKVVEREADCSWSQYQRTNELRRDSVARCQPPCSHKVIMEVQSGEWHRCGRACIQPYPACRLWQPMVGWEGERGRARMGGQGDQIREIGKNLPCWMPSMLRRKAWMRQPMKRLRKM